MIAKSLRTDGRVLKLTIHDPDCELLNSGAVVNKRLVLYEAQVENDDVTLVFKHDDLRWFTWRHFLRLKLRRD